MTTVLVATLLHIHRQRLTSGFGLCKQGLEALQPRLQAWLGRMGSAADALLAATQPAGAGSWDLENKVGLAVAFGLGADRAPVVWLDLLLPQARPCTRPHVSYLVRHDPDVMPCKVLLHYYITQPVPKPLLRCGWGLHQASIVPAVCMVGELRSICVAAGVEHGRVQPRSPGARCGD